jgi:ubiquinone/menaquinone biosynthesis C-methylase UbiE
MLIDYLECLPMNIQHAYNQWSSSYDQDRNLTRDLDQAVTRQLLADKELDHVLELGCGTGKNTALLSQIAKQVHALDFSEGMIQLAMQKIRSGNVLFNVADLNQAWPCIDAAYQLIICNLVLEHIENLFFIFEQAARCLSKGGQFYVSELHPFRQYQGGKARYQEDGQTVEVDAYVHHISEFLNAAKQQGMVLAELNEYWHQDDSGKPPRLVTFLFKKL